LALDAEGFTAYLYVISEFISVNVNVRMFWNKLLNVLHKGEMLPKKKKRIFDLEFGKANEIRNQKKKLVAVRQSFIKY
jgi:hypothetical protein